MTACFTRYNPGRPSLTANRRCDSFGVVAPIFTGPTVTSGPPLSAFTVVTAVPVSWVVTHYQESPLLGPIFLPQSAQCTQRRFHGQSVRHPEGPVAWRPKDDRGEECPIAISSDLGDHPLDRDFQSHRSQCSTEVRTSLSTKIPPEESRCRPQPGSGNGNPRCAGSLPG